MVRDDNLSSLLTFAGVQLRLSAPYREGHVCTASDAKVLNSERHERLRGRVTRLVERTLGTRLPASLTPDERQQLQAEVDALDRTFKLQAHEQLRGVDPTQAEALRIADERVKAALRSRKVDPASIPLDKFLTKIDQVASTPEVIAEAQRRTQALKLTSDLGL